MSHDDDELSGMFHDDHRSALLITMFAGLLISMAFGGALGLLALFFHISPMFVWGYLALILATDIITGMRMYALLVYRQPFPRWWWQTYLQPIRFKDYDDDDNA